jgi:glycogen(starch) synthase
MNIVLDSYTFAPRTGGIETVGAVLVSEWIKMGNEVVVTTKTPCEKSEKHASIIRNPNISLQRQLLKWCDIYCQSNISLKSIGIAIASGKPVVIIHHTWFGSNFATRTLKLLSSSMVTRNVVVSRAIGDALWTQSDIMGNPYDSTTFTSVISFEQRTKNLAFVGRLCRAKGAHDLLDALGKLHKRGIQPTLTIVGDGPERLRLTEQAVSLGIAGNVRFLGNLQPAEVASVLNHHQMLVVPSRWEEPFGVVALEGIACGCAILGSAGGGLPEAIGPCGEVFQNGDVDALTNKLKNFLSSPQLFKPNRNIVQQHLEKHKAKVVAQKYITLFSQCLKRSGHCC